MKKKLNALLLTFCILFSVVAAVLPVYAVEADGGIGVVGATDSVLKVEKLVLNEDDVPEVISFQSAQEKGHVLRLRDKEDDNYTVALPIHKHLGIDPDSVYIIGPETNETLQ